MESLTGLNKNITHERGKWMEIIIKKYQLPCNYNF